MAVAATPPVFFQTQSATCKTGSCLVQFPILAGALYVTTVSCNLTFNNPQSQPSFTGTQIGHSNESGDFTEGQYLGGYDIIGSSQKAQVIQILADTQYVVPSGTHPAIQLGLAARQNTVASCTIAGTQ
jgi:hypothetical protein